MQIYLPEDVRQTLAQAGMTPPPNGSPELPGWLSNLKSSNPEMYAAVIRRVIQATPETETEKAQKKARKVMAFRGFLRRNFTKRSAVGDRVPNTRLMLISGLAGVVFLVMVTMALSGMNVGGGNRSSPDQAPPQTAGTAQPAQEPRVAMPPVQAQPQAPASPSPAQRQQPGQTQQAGSPQQAGLGLVLPPVPSSADQQAVSQPPMQPPPSGTPVVSAQVPESSGPRPVVVVEARREPSGGSGVVVLSGSGERAEPGFAVVEARRERQQQGSQRGEEQSGKGREPRDDEAQSEEQRPALQLSVGQVLDGVLETGVVVYEGASVPVIVKSSDGAVWVGAASLQQDRVQAVLDRVVVDGKAARVQAVLLEQGSRASGLPARITERGADVARSLMAGAVQGFSQYLQAVAQAGRTVVTNGSWAVVTQNDPGPAWAYILGGVAGQVANAAPSPRSQVVRVAEIPRGAKVSILVLSSPEFRQ